MAWLNVSLKTQNGKTTPNVITVDAIVRVGPTSGGGAYIDVVDGQSIEVSDSFEEIVDQLRKLIK